jgi:large subunit ribosomal protein L25
METLELIAEERKAAKGHAKELRQQGLVPAVVYGKKTDSQLLQIDAKALHKVISVTGTHQLISLQVPGKKGIVALAREIQRDPVKRNYVHIDFLAVQMDEKITATIPLHIEGHAPAVADLGGVLTQNMDELHIECLPGDLVNAIVVDISSLLELNDSLTVADLTIPAGITVLSDPDSMVVKIEAPRTAESLEELEEAPDFAGMPEVITEAKDEE